jgi:dienelactone hydrolase
VTAVANCAALALAGDPEAPQGTSWSYTSTDADGTFALTGVLLVPSGTGPFPAIVVSHGKGGQAGGYSRTAAVTMRGWGAVVIATDYSHAAAPAGQPAGPDGASAENIARGWKARQLLACIPTVDVQRVAAHGHSMGAFATSGLLATHPTDFIVASHTAGGVNSSNGPEYTASLSVAEAAPIATPYQLHHGDLDEVVRLGMDEDLAEVLAAHGVPHELLVYPGYDHAMMALDTTMLERVRIWYADHGLF